MVWDLFVTHAWRYHEDWIRVSELLDSQPGLKWRNFSVPWHDPAMDPNTDVGGRFVRDWLETQIIPVTGVILLSSLLERGSAKRWIQVEIGLARQYHKPIVGLPPQGQTSVPEDALELVDAVAAWTASGIIGAFEDLKHRNDAQCAKANPQ
jgi:hypothetical protein